MKLKTLDAGADGIIAPMVKNEEDIENIINQSYFPPEDQEVLAFAGHLIMEQILKIIQKI